MTSKVPVSKYLEARLLSEGAINFFSKKTECRSLSNFWECDIVIRNGENRIGLLYESGEHAFQGEKYLLLSKLTTNNERKKQLLDHGITFVSPSDYKTALKAKQMGGKKGLRLMDRELNQWTDLCVSVQYKISRYKIETYDEVKNDLHNSKGKLLVHPAMRCSEGKAYGCFWEGRAVVHDGQTVSVIGENKLGEIWMDLRKSLMM
jgi:predicted NAD-dependent protein-ADP-ribosyltransferase YbiA (DUF1768 family)